MGLENLKSIFQDSLNDRIRDYITTNIQGMDDSKIAKEIGSHNNNPILNTLLRGQVYTTSSPPILSSVNSFVNDMNKPNKTHPFQKKKFPDGVTSTFRSAKIPTDYSEAGSGDSVFSPLSKVQQNVYTGEIGLGDSSWENLYLSNHKPNPNASFQNITPISYPNVNRDKLDIRANSAHTNLFSPSRTELLGIGAGEPYIVSKIGTGGRLINAGSQEVPIVRSLTDGVRIAKFLTSPMGVAFTLRQNALGLISKSEYPLTTDSGWNYAIGKSPQRFNTFYNPLSTLGTAVARLVGTVPNVKIRKDELFPNLLGQVDSKYPGILSNVKDLNINLSFFNKQEQILDVGTNFPIAAGIKTRNPIVKSGDKMTLASMITGVELNSEGITTVGINENGMPTSNALDIASNRVNVESIKHGMPLYFKDLRDNTYVFFRAYIEGLTENVSPSWTPHNYIGRSEPVYTYERAERELNFTLKLVAQSPDELEMIYKKMNKLTSLCYPEYVGDEYGKNRMKPPLTQFRLGELFGTSNNEMLGFIKSLSYSVDQSSTWETAKDKRVPRHVNTTISYQVVHGKTPDMNDTQFYGFVGS